MIKSSKIAFDKFGIGKFRGFISSESPSCPTSPLQLAVLSTTLASRYIDTGIGYNANEGYNNTFWNFCQWVEVTTVSEQMIIHSASRSSGHGYDLIADNDTVKILFRGGTPTENTEWSFGISGVVSTFANVNCFSGSTFETGVRHLFIIAYNAANMDYKLYINGVYFGSISNLSPPNPLNSITSSRLGFMDKFYNIGRYDGYVGQLSNWVGPYPEAIDNATKALEMYTLGYGGDITTLSYGSMLYNWNKVGQAKDFGNFPNCIFNVYPTSNDPATKYSPYSGRVTIIGGTFDNEVPV